MSVQKLLIIVPCRNEAEDVPGVLSEIAAAMKTVSTPHAVLVVDDASTDDTARAARAGGAQVLALPAHGGLAVALHAGHRFAVRYGFDACIHLDGDGQHPASEIPRFLESHEQAPCDIILGSRYLRAEGFRAPLLRRLGQRVLGWTMRALHGARVSDPSSGFKLVTGEAVRIFAEAEPVDYPEPIFLSLITSHAFTFREIPVVMRQRVHGQSYLSGLTSLSFMLRASLRLVLSARRKT